MAYEGNLFDWVHDIEGLSVLHAEFVSVTADGADHPLYERVAPLLQRIHRVLSIDVVFVSQLVAGRPAMRDAVSREQKVAIAAAHTDPLEAEYGRRVLESRPGHGEFLALPVAGKDGFEYGTVCCRTAPEPSDAGDNPERGALFSVARLVALALSVWDKAKPVDVWASTAAAPLELTPVT